MRISGGGYSTILANLKEAKKDLLTGNYGLMGELNRIANGEETIPNSMYKVSEKDIVKDSNLRINVNEKPTVFFSDNDMIDATHDWKSFQKDVCSTVNFTAMTSGLSRNLADSLGLTQSFDSIDDFANAISNACLDISA